MPKIYIIDGNAYLHRAYHALPPLTNSRGEPIGAVFGFLKFIFKLMKAHKPDYTVVCFDFPAPTFRHKQYLDYKSHRKETEPDLKFQMPLAREAMKAINIPVIEKEGFEADDVIATLAKRSSAEGLDVVIVTGDKDALQLVGGNIKVWNEHKNIMFDEAVVIEKYSLKPAQLNDMFALMGDSSDNVPGAKGIGEKPAVKLIQQFSSIDNLLNNTQKLEGKLKDNILSSKDNIILSKSLVTLRDDVPLDIRLSELKTQSPDSASALDFFSSMGFKSLIPELGAGSAAAAVSADFTPEERQLKPPAFDFEIVNSTSSLKSLITGIRKAGFAAIDLETTSLNTYAADIVGISLSYEKGRAFYIPLGHFYLGVDKQLDLRDTLEKLKEVLEDDKVRIYGQNIKFDYLILKRHGIEPANLSFDTMLAAYCLDPSRASFGLKKLSSDFLSEKMTEISELIGSGKQQTTMSSVAIDKAAPYACADAAAVVKLAEYFAPKLKEAGLNGLFNDIEMPLVKILAFMENEGIEVDLEYLNKLALDFDAAIESLKSKIFESAGGEFNPNSTKQLAEILFTRLKLPVQRKTKTGFSTDEEALSALAPLHKLPATLLEYRELQKLKSTYIDSIIELTDKNNRRIHTSLNQTGTATGRLSSSDPNLQNIPIRSGYGRQIRRAFISGPGNLFVSADYSQIDLRVLAHISQDQSLISAFINGEDIHTATAAEIFGKSASQIDENDRRVAKTINFGVIYGLSAFGLSQQLGISNQQAQEFIDNYFKRYSGVREWIGRSLIEASKNGHVKTLAGRIRHIPDINSGNKQAKKFAERIAINTQIQGTSADIIKIAMIDLFKCYRNGTLKAKMLMQVHDDLLFVSERDNAAGAVKLVKEKMENAVKLSVPLTVEVKTGTNWADLEA